ncbi:MAG: triose-phosphate isomerase [Kiritimatiellia bacterium]
MARKYRKKIIAGNWKMNKSVAEAESLAGDIKLDLAENSDADVVLCPPFTSLKVVSDEISDTYIKLGAQNMHWESDGAYTGEISANMLRDLYCHYVILGHSERRGYFGETDEIVNRKVKAALECNLVPIVCVGETLEQREAGRMSEIVGGQVRNSLAGLGGKLKTVIVAYEPIWAIGTGRTATPDQAQEAHAFVRKTLEEISDSDTAASIRIQYGGSVKPGNAADLLGQADIDGALVGGASLDARSFCEIVHKGV